MIRYALLVCLLFSRIGYAQPPESMTDPKVQVVQEFHENGTPKLWRQVVAGKAHGLWLEWNSDGQLRYRSYWQNGLGHGVWEYFHDNGQLRSRSYFIKDQAEGIYLEYYPDGSPHREWSYTNGKKHGWQITYDVQGMRTREWFEHGEVVEKR